MLFGLCPVKFLCHPHGGTWWRWPRKKRKNGGRPQNIGYRTSRQGNYFAKIQSSSGPSARYQRFQKKNLQTVVKKLQKSFNHTASRNVLSKSGGRNSKTLGILQKVENGRSPNALSHEQLASCADLVEANMEFARKPGNFTKNIYKVKETYIQACELKR